MEGLRIRDPQTLQVTLDTTDRVSRVIGYIDIGPGAGSFTVPDDAEGTVFYYLTSTVTGDFRGPTVTLEGRTLSWVPGSNGGSNAFDPARMWYGVY